MLDDKPIVIFLFGPTAVGKTNLALSLYHKLPCMLISVDSAMVYKDLDIGTAKPHANILSAIPHELIDIITPDVSYSAGSFYHDVIGLIKTAINAHKIPLLVGGTMLYFHVLNNGLAVLPKADVKVRAHLAKLADLYGNQYLYQTLSRIDHVTAIKLDPNDHKRIVRALEVFMLTGNSITYLQQNSIKPLADYRIIPIGIVPSSRAALHMAIKRRSQQMLRHGFVDEVKMLCCKYQLHHQLPASLGNNDNVPSAILSYCMNTRFQISTYLSPSASMLPGAPPAISLP